MSHYLPDKRKRLRVSQQISYVCHMFLLFDAVFTLHGANMVVYLLDNMVIFFFINEMNLDLLFLEMRLM
jgi:hypothetical protein